MVDTQCCFHLLADLSILVRLRVGLTSMLASKEYMVGVLGCRRKNAEANCTHRYTNAALNIITDIAASLLPWPVISILDIPSREKFVLKAVFAAGLMYVDP